MTRARDRRAAAAAPGHVPHPVAVADEDRHGYAIIQDVAAAHRRRAQAQRRHALSLDPAHARAGLIVETRERPAPERTTSGGATTGSRRSGTAVARAEARRLATRADGARRAGSCRGGLRCADDYDALYLLPLYPASFRAEYGEEMRAAVRAARGEQAARSGAPRALGRHVRRRRRQRAGGALGHPAAGRRLHFRVLRRTPGFVLTAILVVALGVGATTAAFSLTDSSCSGRCRFPTPTAS